MIDWADTVEGWVVVALGLPVIAASQGVGWLLWPSIASRGFALSAALKRQGDTG